MAKIKGIRNWLKQCKELGKDWTYDKKGAIVFRPETIKEAKAIVDYMFSNYQNIKIMVESEGLMWTNLTKEDFNEGLSNNN
jgi:hypothetical protein